jgi:hypothetical protein
MTTQYPILIDTPDPLYQEWNKRKWIGVGKKYPVSGEVPAFIEAARSKVLAVPSIYSLYIPNQKMSITDLLKAKLPVQSSALIMHSVTGAFSKEEANDDMACLKTRPIPPKAWLEQLDKDFRQAWFDGNRSIEDKRYKNSRLQLFALTYWKEMRIVIEKRAIWWAADEWLARWAKSGKLLEEADRAREMMSCLTWGLDITAFGGGCPKENLTVLLSDNWIDGETIDMMMFYLATHVRLDPELRKTTVVASLNLQMHINRAYETRDYSKKSVPLLCRYTELFKEKKRTHLYFPAHIGGNHWVPFSVDFKKQTIQHGKCLTFVGFIAADNILQETLVDI